MHADFIIYTHRHTYLKQGSSFTDLPATRGPDCAKLYIGPGKKSDEDECDGCADGGGASPITKAETKVKNKLYKKNHMQTSHQAIFLYNTYNIRYRHKTTNNSAKYKEPWRLVTTPAI